MKTLFPRLEEEVVRRYLDGAVNVFEAPRSFVNYEHSRIWKNKFPKNPGVYGLYIDGDELVYVGESGNLWARMGDMFDTRNHVFRRNYGKHLFSEREKFRVASSRRQFEVEFEMELNVEMVAHVQIFYFVSKFGRKEIEENLIERFHPKFNHRGRRD